VNAAIEKLAKQLGEHLKKHGLKLVTAESCTAGGLAFAVTAVPGSSEWFERGFVTYTNEAKQTMLGVSSELFSKHGAVSGEVAEAMAQGALKNSESDIAVSITGIAGPGGGTKDKPVGIVWIAMADKAGVRSVCHHFKGDRQSVREQSIETALKGLLVSSPY